MTRILLTSNRMYVPTSRNLRHFSLAVTIVLAIVLLSAPAFAQQGFAMMGTWQMTSKDGVMTVVFSADGRFQTRYCNAPGAGGSGSGCSQWSGLYRPQSASSWAYQIQSFQLCASGGGCNSCPRSRTDLPSSPTYGCDLARSLYGITIGKQETESWRMQGPNQALDQNGRTWRRIR